MQDYEHESTERVQQLAKQGDSDAMLEMMYRFELVQPANSQIDTIAWQDYWLERAAQAGNPFARRKYAGALLDTPCSSDERRAKNRKKAFDVFESLVSDLNSGKLSGEDQRWGIVANIETGIILCEGICAPDGSDRNPSEGIRRIEMGANVIDSEEGLGFRFLHLIGTLYAMGYAQQNELPTDGDIRKAIDYLGRAIQKFPDDENPRLLDSIENMRHTQRERLGKPTDLNAELQRVRNRPKPWQQSENVMRAVLGQEQTLDDALHRLNGRLSR